MKTIFYRHESTAAKAYAAAYGIEYPGRERLNVMHVGDSVADVQQALKVIEGIRGESDYFRGYFDALIEGKG